MSLFGQMSAELRDVDHRREVEDADHLRAEQSRHAALQRAAPQNGRDNLFG